MSALEHLKLCTERAHKTAYHCARCNQVYCMICDHASDASMIKTIVRYCPDWRCQREKQIEEGQLLVTAAKTAEASHSKTELPPAPKFLLFVGNRTNGLMLGADCYLQTFVTLEEAVREGEHFAEHAFGDDWKQSHDWKREDVWWNVLEIADKTAAITHFCFKQGN